MTKLGTTGVELNQRDHQGIELSQDKLAEVVVLVLDSNTYGVTVKTYQAATQARFQSKFDKTSGNERGAATSRRRRNCSKWEPWYGRIEN